MNAEGNWPTKDSSLRRSLLSAGEVVQKATRGQWKLRPQEWSAVDSCLTSLAEGIASGDAGVIRQAAAQLERLEPRRIIGLGSRESAVPMPELTRERLNEIVHSIDRLRSDTAEQASDTKPEPAPKPSQT